MTEAAIKNAFNWGTGLLLQTLTHSRHSGEHGDRQALEKESRYNLIHRQREAAGTWLGL